MNNNSLIKKILAGLFLAALYAYSRFYGGAVVTPSSPDVPVNIPSETESPKWSPPESAPADTDSNDSHARHEQRVPSNRTPPTHHSDPDRTSPSPRDTGDGPRHDLSQDEKHHGHTLQRHVGRTDEQLIERLREETDISSASTWTDRDIAERTVGLALEKNKSKIDAWTQHGPNRGKLAFDYIGDGRTQIGRSIHRGETRSVPCYNAKVVLIPDGDSFHVLTTYPEGR